MKQIEDNNATLLRLLPPIILEPPMLESGTSEQPTEALPKKRDNRRIALLQFLHANLSKGIGVAQGSAEFTYRGHKLTRADYEAELKSMVADKLCECIPYRRSLKGAATNCYIPSQIGYDLLGNPSDMCVPVAGSGIEEAFFLRVLPAHFKASHNIIMVPHLRRNGKTPDLAFEHAEEMIAVELSFTTDAKHEAQNAANNISADFGKSISVFMTSKKVEAAAATFRAQLGHDILSSIKIAHIWQLFSCSSPDQLIECPGLMVSLPEQESRSAKERRSRR